MSVVVWDGSTLAADRGAWRGNLVTESGKLHVINVDTLSGERRAVVGFVGDMVRGAGFCQAIKEQGYPLKEAPVDGMDDVEALVLLIEQGQPASLYYHDQSVRGAEVDADAPFVIGNEAAAAAALALVTIADMTAQEAVREMVSGGRFDAVAVGVDWCTALSASEEENDRPEEYPPETAEAYTPEMDAKNVRNLTRAALEAVDNLELVMKTAWEVVALRNLAFGSPDHRSYAKLSEGADHVAAFAAAFIAALDVNATDREALQRGQ